MANITVLTGNLTEDPVLRYTSNGNAVADCGFAVNTYRKDGDPEVSFFKLSVWRDLAEHFSASCRKGDQIVVSGRIEVQRFDRTDGSVGTSVVITADEIGASLRFAEVEIHKVRKAEVPTTAPRRKAVRQPIEDEYEDEDDVPPSTRRAVPSSRRQPIEADEYEEEDDVQEPTPAPTTRRVVRKPLSRKAVRQPEPVEEEDEDEEEVVF